MGFEEFIGKLQSEILRLREGLDAAKNEVIRYKRLFEPTGRTAELERQLEEAAFLANPRIDGREWCKCDNSVGYQCESCRIYDGISAGKEIIARLKAELNKYQQERINIASSGIEECSACHRWFYKEELNDDCICKECMKEARMRLCGFEEDWNAPGMDKYDKL